jgi:hypothetical protein
MVADHYAKLGFTKVGEEKSGQTHWELQVAEEPYINIPVKVISPRFAVED